MNPADYLEHIDFQATTKLDFTTLFRGTPESLERYYWI